MGQIHVSATTAASNPTWRNHYIININDFNVSTNNTIVLMDQPYLWSGQTAVNGFTVWTKGTDIHTASADCYDADNNLLFTQTLVPDVKDDSVVKYVLQTASDLFSGSNYGDYHAFSSNVEILPRQANDAADIALVEDYFDTHPEPPASGSGTATVEIDIEGEQLTFESQMLGNTITRFIDDDAEVDMEE